MSYLRVKKFWDYQNADAWKKAKANKGGHRHPAWYKAHVSRDMELDCEEPMTRLVWKELLGLATIHENAILNDISKIANAISLPSDEVRQAIEVLLKGGWLSETRSSRPSRVPSRNSRAQNKIEKREEPPISPPPNGNGWIPDLNSYTGCKIVRGTHGGGHVYDVLGQDRPPTGWPYERPTRDQIRTALLESV